MITIVCVNSDSFRLYGCALILGGLVTISHAAAAAELTAGAAPYSASTAPVMGRGGLIVPGRQRPGVTGPGIEIEPTPTPWRGRTLWSFGPDFAWSEGQAYQATVSAEGLKGPVEGGAATTTRLMAPLRPRPHQVARIPLENVRSAAATGVTPDCVLKFAPDNRHLAIGSFGGYLRIADAWTGDVRYRLRLAEGIVKQLAWSADGKTLYVGEQSPDGSLWALDCAPLLALSADPDESPQLRSAYARLKLRRVWSLRLADRLQTSRPPRDDRYGVYSWPAVYDLHTATDGRLLLVGVHSWNQGGQPRRRSVVYCVAPTGETLWTWPEQGALPLAVNSIGADAAGTKTLVLAPTAVDEPSADATQSDGAKAAPERAARVVLLDGRTGQELAQHAVEPLGPYFDRVESWKSTSVAADGRRGTIGLGDGRALLLNINPAEPLLELAHTFSLGTPRLVGRTPVAAAASYARCLGDRLYLQTQNTHIPFGNSAAAQQAPSPHRGANTLTVANHEGQPQWRYRGPYSLTGHWADAGTHVPPRWLAVTCREAPGAPEPGQFGFLLFDLMRPGGGEEKLVFHYPTVGPVSFDADMSDDGRLVAVAECPTATPDGRDTYGEYQVHVVH